MLPLLTKDRQYIPVCMYYHMLWIICAYLYYVDNLCAFTCIFCGVYMSSGSQVKSKSRFPRFFFPPYASSNYWEVPSLSAYLCSRLHACQSDYTPAAWPLSCPQPAQKKKKKTHSCTCGQKYSLCNHHKSNRTNNILS